MFCFVFLNLDLKYGFPPGLHQRPELSCGPSACYLIILDRQPSGQACQVCQIPPWENVPSEDFAFKWEEKVTAAQK